MRAPGGEFDLIREMLSVLPASVRSVRLGPGDDAAVTAPTTGSMVAAADLLIEGRHFDLAFSSPSDVGYKAMSANVSDMAAMGATPLYVLLSVGLPHAGARETGRALYEGIGEACDAYAVAVIGGDTVGSELLTVSIAVIGEAGDPVTRAGARAGDAVCVTGSLGAAAAGLTLLRMGEHVEAERILDRFPLLGSAHRRGQARVREGREAATGGAHAMIDISDGLLSDAGHICERSEVGMLIDVATLPMADGVIEAAELTGSTPEAFALSGGDDYELLIVLDPGSVGSLRASVAPTPLTVIGEVTETLGLRDAAGNALEMAGWDHFAS